MSRKNTTKRLAKTLARNRVEPTQPGLLQMIRGLGLRPRSVRRAMMRGELKALRRMSDQPINLGAVGFGPWSARWKEPPRRRIVTQAGIKAAVPVTPVAPPEPVPPPE